MTRTLVNYTNATKHKEIISKLIEAMAGDVIFDSKLQRTINVDIRYVLWLIDKFAQAKHIVDELTIVSK